MIRFLTAGESHGKALLTIVEGFPSNLEISEDYLNRELKRRQSGYGRGGRMKIETDKVEFMSGVRKGKTLGSPICMMIRNLDWENWTEVMSVNKTSEKTEPVTIPRPGHADLTGTIKYDFDDIRNSIERSSARETAARVAAGTTAKRLLEEFGIFVGSYVESIGGIYSSKSFYNDLLENKQGPDNSAENINLTADQSEVRVLDNGQEKKIISKIKSAKKRGDTLGGTFIVVTSGLPAGLGSFVHYDRKLSSAVSSAIMSINGVKGVEIGAGFRNGDRFGSQVHDEFILRNNEITRRTNRAGGTEGGISTGMPLIVRAVMKPISTLMMPLKSVDLKTLKEIESRRERSDFVAVPACAVIAESMIAWVIAEFFVEKFGGDSISEMKKHYSGYKKQVLQQIKKRF